MKFDVERKVKCKLLGCTHSSHILFLINKKNVLAAPPRFPIIRRTIVVILCIVIEGNTDVKRLILSIAVILFAILSAVTLRGYVYGDQQGDPEYYILLFSLFCGAASAVCLWRLAKS